MSRAEFTNWAVDEAGNVVASAAFEVRWRSNASLVTTVYDAASGVGTVSNPGTATSGGLVNFWLPYGEYEITIGSGASAVTIPFDAAPATGVPRSFASRAAAVTEWAAMVARSETPPAGTVWTFGGVSIEYDGSTTAISDFSGWKPSGQVTWVHFGATGDETTDDTDAFNSALAYVRSFEDSSTLLRPHVISGMGRRYLIDGSINATLIRLGKGWGIEDTWIIATGTGKTVVDLTASRFGYFENLHIWGGVSGDSASDPHTGILVARASPSSTYPCDSHTWVNCSVDGYFSHSAYTEYASEVTQHTGCIFWNRRVANGSNPAYAAVLQGNSTIGMVSDYQTLDTGRQSFTVKQYDLCRFQKPFGIAGPTMYLEDIASTRFNKPYVTNGSGDIIVWELNSGFSPYDVEFDGLQIETTGSDRAFVFTSDTASAFTVLGLRVSFGNIFTEDAVFDVDGPSEVILSGLHLSIPRWQSSAPTATFANASNFRLTGANVVLPAASDMESLSSFASGTTFKLYGHDTKVWRSYGIERLASGVPIVADGAVATGAGGSVADDAVVSLDLDALGFGTNGIFSLWSTAAGCAAQIFFRADATPVILMETKGTAVDTTTSTTLAGTTGTDGRFTISINDGQIQLENRRGFSVSYRYFVNCFNASV